jgi:protein involved in polysaccharide export with SLBB domain
MSVRILCACCAVCCFSTIAIAGDAPSRSDDPLAPPRLSQPVSTAVHVPSGYRLASGDLLRIDVARHADLSTTVRIAPGSDALFPLIGDLGQLNGRSVGDVREDVRRRLEADYLNSPDVSITLVEMAPRRVFLFGAVGRQEPVPLTPYQPVTAMQAIAMAGGLATDADATGVAVVRIDPANQSQRLIIPVPLAANPLSGASDVTLLPDDVITVPRQGARRVFVLGSVGTQGAVNLPAGDALSVSQAVSLAGGFATFARPDRVQLLRPGRPPVTVDVEAILQAKGGLDPKVEPGDTISVPDSRF